MPLRATSQFQTAGNAVEVPPPGNRKLAAAGILCICVAAFVIQTELTQFVQLTMQYQKPFFLLYITHSCYMLMIPLQLFYETVVLSKQRHAPRDYSLAFNRYQQQFSISLHDLVMAQPRLNINHRVFLPVDEEEADTTIPFHSSHVRYIIKLSITLAILITVPAYLWYICVNVTSMSTLTVIYNTTCFFAYAFSVWLLDEEVVRAKVLAVILCIIGVITISFWGNAAAGNGVIDSPEATYPYSLTFFGKVLAVVGAAGYGFYEVFYKKHATPPVPSVRFANTLTGCIGLATFLILWIPIPFLHFFGPEPFALPDLKTALYIVLIALCGVVYNASFMCVIALTSPVFAAVGVMLTIPLVAVIDSAITGVTIGWSMPIGSIFILFGFILLIRTGAASHVGVPLEEVEDR